MPDPAVVQAMRRYKADLLLRETVQMRGMARRWLRVERAMLAHYEALAEEAARIRRDGGTVSRELLFSLDRYHRLLAQLNVELGKYTTYAADLIEAEQRRYASLGIAHAADAIELAGPRTIATAFDRLPIDAVEYAVGLVGDGTPLGDYLQDTWGDAAQGITDELVRATAMGVNPRETARRMADGSTRTLNRMLNTARTEQLRIYRLSSREQMRQSGVVLAYKRIATHDSRVCAACLMDEGTEYGLDETMPEHNQGRCLVPGTVVYGPPVQAFVSRRYVGEIVKIRTASGEFLAVTPNHPILTSRGWIAAQFVKEGDDVVSSAGHEWATGCVDPDEYQTPTLVEDVPRALNMARLGAMPVTTQDFHGDGEGSDVSVVWANRLLGDVFDAALFKPRAHVPFCDRRMAAIPLPALRDTYAVLKGLLASSNAFLRDAYTPQMLRLGGLSGKQLVCAGLTAQGHAHCFETDSNRRPTNAALFGDSVLGFASQISGGDLLVRHGQDRAARSGDFLALDGGSLRFGAKQVAGLEFIREALFASVESCGGVLRTFASNVRLDRVLEVGVTTFSGHVYNLQTREGWYISSGIITHNCSLVPVVSGMPELTWTQGPDWFMRQPAKTQEAILGKGRYAAFKAGQFDLDSLITVRRDATWGDSLGVTPLQQLVP